MSTGHLSNDDEEHPNQHENSLTLSNEIGHPLLSLMESQLKQRRRCRTDASVRKNKLIKKRKTVRVTASDLSRKINHLIRIRKIRMA